MVAEAERGDAEGTARVLAMADETQKALHVRSSASKDDTAIRRAAHVKSALRPADEDDAFGLAWFATPKIGCKKSAVKALQDLFPDEQIEGDAAAPAPAPLANEEEQHDQQVVLAVVGDDGGNDIDNEDLVNGQAPCHAADAEQQEQEEEANDLKQELAFVALYGRATTSALMARLQYKRIVGTLSMTEVLSLSVNGGVGAGWGGLKLGRSCSVQMFAVSTSSFETTRTLCRCSACSHAG